MTVSPRNGNFLAEAYKTFVRHRRRMDIPNRRNSIHKITVEKEYAIFKEREQQGQLCD